VSLPLNPPEPGHECYRCGTGLWASDEWRTWAWYFVVPNKPSRPVCMGCAMQRHELEEVTP